MDRRSKSADEKLCFESLKEGYRKQNQSEIAAAEKDQKMRHYYYHCERNPIGFQRLMAENFQAELRDKTLADAPKATKRDW